MAQEVEQQPDNTHLRLILLERDHTQLKSAVSAIEQHTQKIADAMVQLARLEDRHMETREALARAFKAIEVVEEKVVELEKHPTDNLDERLKAVELKMPGLTELRAWVIGGIAAGLLMIAGALFTVLWHSRPYVPHAPNYEAHP